MNAEQYQEQLKQLIEIHTKAVSALKMNYVKANKKLNIGDIAKSRSGEVVIKIDKIQYSDNDRGLPVAVYSGFILTKKLEPRKDKQRFSIFENE